MKLTKSDEYILLCALLAFIDEWGCDEAEIDVLKKFRKDKYFSAQFEKIDDII